MLKLGVRMESGRFLRVTKIENLEEIARMLLKRLFGLSEYAVAFVQAVVAFPDDSLPDED